MFLILEFNNEMFYSWTILISEGKVSVKHTNPKDLMLIWHTTYTNYSDFIEVGFFYLPGRYSLECKILSIMPPVLPILKHPGLIPPTVAGPIMDTLFWWAIKISFRVWFSGIPSAIMAIVLIWNKPFKKIDFDWVYWN